MKDRYSFASLTRISDLKNKPFTVEALPKDDWSLGDYVLGKVTQPYPKLRLELPDGRMMELVRGDLVVGALGVRHATLEATGTWKRIGSDGLMHLLTGAGLLGKMTSKSVFLAKLVELKYQGHLLLEGEKSNMKDFVPPVPDTTFDIPVILVVGTSMSAGKTTAACILIRQLKRLGLSVVGAKVTGAGRYQDILAMRDSGADQVFDFVDAGLGTSICSQEEFLRSLKVLLNLIGGAGAEVAVIEIGASPLEPYNGDLAIDAIRDQVRMTVLCASDPYAVLGVMKSFSLKPSVVSGIATNTLAGVELIQKLCDVRALNLIEPENLPTLRKLLAQRLETEVSSTG